MTDLKPIKNKVKTDQRASIRREIVDIAPGYIGAVGIQYKINLGFLWTIVESVDNDA